MAWLIDIVRGFFKNPCIEFLKGVEGQHRRDYKREYEAQLKLRDEYLEYLIKVDNL